MARDIELTMDGGYIVTGSSVNNVDTIPNYDIYVVKLSNTGALEWGKVIDSGNHEQASDIIASLDGLS